MYLFKTDISVYNFGLNFILKAGRIAKTKVSVLKKFFRISIPNGSSTFRSYKRFIINPSLHKK